MAGQESDLFLFDISEEEVTAEEVDIILISSDSEVEADKEAQVKPQVVLKKEQEFLPLVQYSSSESGKDEDSSFLWSEDNAATVVGEGEEEKEVDDEEEEELEVEEAEVEVQMVEEEEESFEEEVVAGPSRGRCQSTTPLAPAGTLWQRCPNPPAKRPRVAYCSPAWEFYLVPIGTSKATADIVKCRLCPQQVSRGQPSHPNQARGTANMLRHLYQYHWDVMSASFRDRYRDARSRALRLSVGQDVAGVVAPRVMPLSAESAEASHQPASDLSRPHPLPVRGGRYTAMCRFCMKTVCGLDVDFESWRDLMRAHEDLCPRY